MQRSDCLNLGCILLLKDYLIRKLRSEQEQIEKDQTEIRRFRQESEYYVQKVKQLETE